MIKIRQARDAKGNPRPIWWEFCDQSSRDLVFSWLASNADSPPPLFNNAWLGPICRAAMRNRHDVLFESKYE